MVSIRTKQLITASLVVSAFAVVGCQTNTGTVIEDEERAATREESRLNDAQIAGVVTAVNQGEIDLARMALERADSQNVRDYAQLMIRDHQQAQDALQQIQQSAAFSTASSNVRRNLTSQVATLRRDLERMSGPSFEREYLRSQVALHDQAIRLSDERLLREAQSEELRDFLTELRPILENHREIARRVQEGQPVAVR